MQTGANSPFGGVVAALLLPLLLTDLAEEYGCGKTAFGCDINANDLETGEIIQVHVGVWELKATSYAAAMIGISSLVQAIAYLWVGPLADYSNYKTSLFRITAFATGTAVCCYILFGDASLWQVAGWWSVITMVLYGLSIIFYNSWLPILVETHPDVVAACKADKDHKAGSTQNGTNDDALKQLIAQKTDHLALVGFSWGYIAGIVVMITCLVILVLEPAAYTANDAVGSSDILQSGTNTAFSELWARKVTALTIYHSISRENTLSPVHYINGMQLYYDGIDGDLYGEMESDFNSTVIVDEDDHHGFERVVLYQFVDDQHLCGLELVTVSTSFHIGNTTEIEEVVISKVIAEHGKVFGGISGTLGTLKDITNITGNVVISELSILMVSEDGQFGTLYERIGILINGIWFLLFAAISVKFLKNRPGPPLPEGERVMTFGLKQTINTLRSVRRFPTMFKYMVCKWECYQMLEMIGFTPLFCW